MANDTASSLVTKPSDREQLSRDAWLDAAATAVAEGGFDNVRVLTLAKRLGVTRGSFYWHFQDHAELVTSFLDRWRDRRLRELVHLKPASKDIETEVHRIVHMLLSEPARTTRRMRIELAVRDFARREPYAAKIVAEVDAARVAQTASLLQNVTGNAQRARDLALLFYIATIGAQVVLTASHEGEEAIVRMERLIAEILAAKGCLGEA
ncbi:MAG: TetR/AcrR family transcriptional regulator [Sulfurifustis sp.]